MARNPACTVYIGNLDEKVSERVLYEILIQVGRVVDLYIPRDKETDRHKGYAFAEYESEKIADYAVKLYSGLVRLHNKTLKFAMSGQDKAPQDSTASANSQPNNNHFVSNNLNNGPNPISAPQPHIAADPTTYRNSALAYSPSAYPQVSSGGLVNGVLRNSSYEYNRRVLGAVLDSVSRPASRHPIAYPSY